MPFTPAHTAAALPLSRVLPRIPLSAIVLGTMAPDFEYLLRLAPRGQFGHTPLGLLVFCVPLGCSAYLAFAHIVRPALLKLLPPGLAAAVQPARNQSLSLVALGGLLGAATHIWWDAFTHADGWMVDCLPVLTSTVALGRTLALPWYKVLQHGSTVLGGIVSIAWLAAWIHQQPKSARDFAPGQAKHSVTVVVWLLTPAVLAGIANGFRARQAGIPVVLGFVAVGMMSSLAIAVLVYGWWSHSRRDTRSEQYESCE